MRLPSSPSSLVPFRVVQGASKPGSGLSVLPLTAKVRKAVIDGAKALAATQISSHKIADLEIGQYVYVKKNTKIPGFNGPVNVLFIIGNGGLNNPHAVTDPNRTHNFFLQPTGKNMAFYGPFAYNNPLYPAQV